ncbi:hypothetical protein BTRA_3996 [Burkholderia thailandensis USAMRU Malaysia |uniref:Ig-like domain-containing protein n=2 Tax=Burkholderia thailandensis TaxID=57975 RepID=Q2T4M0_BURTA|nr:hypothetical protein [Burkholderia thailandensis]AHI76949.1 hypothetical protein BTQ_4973 [Burkholderia thailandensis 2002721723]AHI81962.1 hypothetical protein BTJ_3600 [Burkholderia thailandensis E444]AIC90175.1 hypothetical protein BTRA_3996 [Burkholderia thailandensis USAMRU Malaysia \
MKHLKIKAALVCIIDLACLHGGAAWAGGVGAAPLAGDAKALRNLLCAANGGRDITDQGTLKAGGDVTAVVVCQYPEPAAHARAAGARGADAASAAVSASVAGGPILSTPVIANLRVPGGTFSLAAGNPLPLSCGVDLAIARWPNTPAVSQGTSTFNCRGYNVGSSSNGCSVRWSGPTPVTVGATPYGGGTTLNFACTATHLGAFSTVTDYSYRDPVDPRIWYDVRDRFGTVNVQP